MASFVVPAGPREPSDTAEPCDLGLSWEWLPCVNGG